MRHLAKIFAARVRGTSTQSCSSAAKAVLVAPIAARISPGPTRLGISSRRAAKSRAIKVLRLCGRPSSNSNAPASVSIASRLKTDIPVSRAAVTIECKWRSFTGSPSRTSPAAYGQCERMHVRRISWKGANASSSRKSRESFQNKLPNALPGSSRNPLARAASQSRTPLKASSPSFKASKPFTKASLCRCAGETAVSHSAATSSAPNSPEIVVAA